jgi:hypothetical protein
MDLAPGVVALGQGQQGLVARVRAPPVCRVDVLIKIVHIMAKHLHNLEYNLYTSLVQIARDAYRTLF